MTVRDLIAESLRMIGVYGASETPEAEDAAAGLRRLNALVDLWQAERLAIYTVTRTTWSIVAGQAAYSVTISGGARPNFVDHINVIDADTGKERPLRMLTVGEYAEIQDKAFVGRPEGAYYNPTFPNGTITLYPVPESNATGAFYAPNPVQEFDSLDDVVYLPPGYRLLLLSELAIALAVDFSAPIPPDLRRQATDAKTIVKRSNARPLDVRVRTDGRMPAPGLMEPWRF